MSGSEQFLGQQLSKQAKALSELVEQMQQTVINTGNAVPKFANASNTVQKVLTEEGMAFVDFKNANIIKVMMNGTIKIKGYIGTYTSSHGVIIYNNGVEIYRKTYNGGQEGVFEIDIVIDEGDEITFDMANSGSFLISQVYVCYDLIPKPDLIIGGVING